MHRTSHALSKTRATTTILCVGLAWMAHGCDDAASALLAPFGTVGAARISKPYLQIENATGVVVSWFTPLPIVGSVEIQPLDNAVAGQMLSDPQPVRHHAIRIDSLQANTAYRYRLTGLAATDPTWHSLPSPKSVSQPVVLAVLGDSGYGLPVEYAVANQIAASDADYVLHAGDVVYPAGADIDYDRAVFWPLSAFMTEKPLLPCVGNHDVVTPGAGAYLENFILPRNAPAGITPEHTYSIDLGAVHLASLDLNTDATTVTDVIIPWLRSDMQATAARWKIVLFHFPLYTSGTAGRPPDPGQLSLWGGLFDELGIDLCVAGHNHYYERSQPIRDGQVVAPGAGTVYLVCGNGGAPLYTLAPRASYSAASTDQTHGFSRLAFDGAHIELSHISQDGRMIDQTAWDKP